MFPRTAEPACLLQSVKTLQFLRRECKIGNDSGVFPLEETAAYPHWSALELYTTWLFNFYKSSSARQEKTRPVAILSTTPQPYFRFHLNATCAVCVWSLQGRDAAQKDKIRISFEIFFASPYLQMFLKSYRQYLSHFLRIYLSGESVRKERGRGQKEEWMWSCIVCALNVPKSQIWWVVGSLGGLRWYHTNPVTAPIQ